jgi:hypothetical protein
MDRYFIDGLTVGQDYYPIFDRAASRAPIATCRDGDIAMRIVRLLNEDDRKKGTAK